MLASWAEALGVYQKVSLLDLMSGKVGGGVGHDAWSHLQLSSMWLLETGFPIFPESIFVLSLKLKSVVVFRGVSTH